MSCSISWSVDVVGGEAVLSRYKAQSEGEMGLAHAGWAEKYHILPAFQETHGGQPVDLALINRGLKGKTQVVQRLLDGKHGHLDLLLISQCPLEFCLF